MLDKAKLRLKKSSKFLANCERGVSLVQVLMASTAIAGIALVGIKLAEEQRKVVDQVYQTYLVEYFQQEVVQLLNKPQICRTTMSGKNPELDIVTAIREKVGESGEKVFVYFPSKDGGEGDGKLYNGEVKLKSYKIVGKHPRANLNKNVSVLQLEVQSGKEGKVTLKEIPFSFTKDEKGRIEECSAQVASGDGPTEGFWKRKSETLAVENLQVALGNIGERGSGLAVEGRLNWQEAPIEDSCNSKMEGVLQYNAQGRLVYCSKDRWLSFGQNYYRWNEAVKYRHGLSQAGQSVSKTRQHRFCFITRQSINTASDTCELRRLDKEEKSIYEMIAKSGEQVTNLDCEVSCVD